MAIPYKIKLLLWLNNLRRNADLEGLDPVIARSEAQATLSKIGALLDYPKIPLFEVSNRSIKGRHGAIPIRIYRPNNAKGLPVIIYFHGGGFVMRSIDSHDKVCRRLSRDSDAIVVSVGYRLAPENKFPIPSEDCFDATVWIANNTTSFGGDADRIVVMGDSAGGNLATVVCMMSRDSGGPKIIYQVLIYPCTDGHLKSPSITQLGNGYFLTKKMMHWFVNHYKSSDEDLDNPYLSPLLAKDLSNLPPAFIFTAEFDPLKDEGKMYADRLRKAGNDVTFKEYPGMIHGFINIPKLSKKILMTYDDIKDNLNQVFKES